jgi:hypothetical protein
VLLKILVLCGTTQGAGMGDPVLLRPQRRRAGAVGGERGRPGVAVRVVRQPGGEGGEQWAASGKP